MSVGAGHLCKSQHNYSVALSHHNLPDLDGPNTMFSLEGQGKEVEPPRAEGPDIEDIEDMGVAAAAGAMEPGIGEAGMLTLDEAGVVKVEAAVRLRSS